MAIVQNNFSDILKPELKKVYAEACQQRDIDAANIFNNAFTYNGGWEDYRGIDDVLLDKPKLGKVLAYLTPLLFILGVIKNPSMSRRGIFKPWKWFR